MQPIQNYWTRPFNGTEEPLGACELRVRMWLEQYALLEQACRLDCRLDAADVSSQGMATSHLNNSPPPSPRWMNLICIKADLDMAIGTIEPRWAVAVYLRYRYGYTQREIGQKLGCSQGRIWAILDRSIQKIARRLRR